MNWMKLSSMERADRFNGLLRTSRKNQNCSIRSLNTWSKLWRLKELHCMPILTLSQLIPTIKFQALKKLWKSLKLMFWKTQETKLNSSRPWKAEITLSFWRCIIQNTKQWILLGRLHGRLDLKKSRMKLLSELVLLWTNMEDSTPTGLHQDLRVSLTMRWVLIELKLSHILWLA